MRPREWAQALTGVTEQAIQIWVPSTHDTEQHGPAPPPQPTLDWDTPPINPRARQDCAKQVSPGTSKPDASAAEVVQVL